MTGAGLAGRIALAATIVSGGAIHVSFGTKASAAAHRPLTGGGNQDAERLLKKARSAVGGEAALSRIRAFILERWTDTTSVLLPDRYKAVNPTSSGVSVKTLNGAETWTMSPVRPALMPARPRSNARDEQLRAGLQSQLSRYTLVYLLRLPASVRLSVQYAGTVTYGDLHGEAVDFRRKNAPPLRMVFAPNSGKPLGIVRELRTAVDGPRMGDVVTMLEDHREVSGILVPFRLVERFMNQPGLPDRTMRTFQFNAVRLNPPLTVSDFIKPDGSGFPHPGMIASEFHPFPWHDWQANRIAGTQAVYHRPGRIQDQLFIARVHALHIHYQNDHASWIRARV